MAHTATKSFVNQIAVAVVAAGVGVALQGYPVAGGATALLAFVGFFAYQRLADADVQHLAESAARDVAPLVDQATVEEAIAEAAEDVDFAALADEVDADALADALADATDDLSGGGPA